MSDPTFINELRKEIESLCGNCDRPDKEQLGEIILSSMALGFSYGMEADRPQGKWFINDVGDAQCPICGEVENAFIYGTENWYGRGESHYCPNCGARMKGTDDERR